MKTILKKPNGKDVLIKVENSPLQGVYYADYSVLSGKYEIREILSQEVFDSVQKDKEYKIILKSLPYVNSPLFNKCDFSISFETENGVKTFSGCNTVKSECEISPDKILEKYEIKAFELRQEEKAV